MAYALEDADHCFQAGEGLVRDNVEDTIRNMGYVGRVGMKDTDVTILNLMIDQKKSIKTKDLSGFDRFFVMGIFIIKF